MEDSKYDSVESVVLNSGGYVYASSPPNDYKYAVPAGYTPYKKSMYIEDFFIKLALESERLRITKHRSHIKIDNIAYLLVTSVPDGNTPDFNIAFGSEPMSKIDLKDIKMIFKMTVDNVYMLILKSDPITIRFAIDDLDYGRMNDYE